jgi:hypothetical protein
VDIGSLRVERNFDYSETEVWRLATKKRFFLLTWLQFTLDSELLKILVLAKKMLVFGIKRGN